VSEHDFKPAVFLHIQKTAGTSIVDIARHAYGAEHVASHGDYLSDASAFCLDNIVDAKGADSVAFQEKAFISGHFGYGFAADLINQRYSFTFLRDPIERILSFYYFCRLRDPNEFEIYALSQQLSLDDFLKWGFQRPSVKACIWNHQTWQLANGFGHRNGRNIMSYEDSEILALALKNLDRFSHIGFAETFEKDRDKILRDLGIPRPKGKVVSNANPGRPTANQLPASTMSLLRELTKLDQVVYEQAWRQRKTLTEKALFVIRKIVSKR